MDDKEDFKIYSQGFKAGVEFFREEILKSVVDIRIMNRDNFKKTRFDFLMEKLINTIEKSWQPVKDKKL